MVGNVGYAMHPMGVTRASQTGGFGLGIPANAEHKEAAFLLMQWLTSKEGDLAVAMAGGNPSRFSTYQNAELNEKFPWSATFGDFVDEAVFSPDGQRLACIGVENKQHRIVVDGKTWADGYDMAWQPVFSPDSQHAAAKVEKDGKFTIIVDGKPLKETFERVWDPIFSPDSQHVLVRALEGRGADTVYTRTVMPLSTVLG